MQKLGLKPVPGITRVTMKRAKNMLFIVETPEVLKSPNADIYVVLGAAKFEDLSQMPANADLSNIKAELPKKDESKIETIKEEADENDEEDETGLNPEDIKNVMEHTKSTKAKAIKALRSTGGDTVEAILQLQ
jgi:nascent polypeptide-associated complex subunit alpha